jgi:hypothetical protein
MSLNLLKTKATSDLAKLFYDFLPGSGGRVTFQTVAEQAGVGEFWTGGSKRPALAKLFESTLKHRRSQFEPLVLAIVSEAIKYRDQKNTPLRKSDILAINRVINDLGFKFPELWDQAFLESLEREPNSGAEEPAPAMRHTAPVSGSIQAELPRLREEFHTLACAIDRQAAGLALEKFLNRLFQIFGLNPREPFRVVGEQIDGSFELDHEVYLLEVKWESTKIDEAALLTFRGKIEGKSVFTRGLFFAINGFTDVAVVAITKGKQPTFILADGGDLSPVFEQVIRLDDLLRYKMRKLAETGEMLTRAPLS